MNCWKGGRGETFYWLRIVHLLYSYRRYLTLQGDEEIDFGIATANLH